MNLINAETLRGRLNLHHVGKNNGATAKTLALALGVPTRVLRELVTELRTGGVPVCGHPASGYFIAETREELEETCQFLRSRALRSLSLEAKLRKIPVGELVSQVEMALEVGR